MELNIMIGTQNLKPSTQLKSSRTPFLIAMVACVLAMAVHGYLFNHHIQLKFGHGAASGICQINSTFNCDAAVASSYSELFGVPIALWGLLANFGILVLLLLHFFSGSSETSAARRGALVQISVGIFLVSIAMGAITALYLQSLCPFCIASYLLSFVLLICVWIGVGREDINPIASLRPTLSSLKMILLTGVPLLFLGFLINFQAKGSSKDIDSMVESVLAQWASAPSTPIETLRPLILGAEASAARMKIVEFADFRCSHCRDASPGLKAFVKSRPDVRLEFQVFALDGACNSRITRSDGGGCLLAKAAFCADKIKQKGWEVHDYIFANQKIFMSVDSIKQNWKDLASVATMTETDITACTESEESRKHVEAMSSLGGTVGVEGTPAVFVNGRKLEGGTLIPVLQAAYAKIAK
jgi:protein-disulfide isomerase/uncharacterized membrane protein